MEKKKIPAKKEITKKGIRDDLEDMDEEESYYKYMEENPNAGAYSAQCLYISSYNYRLPAMKNDATTSKQINSPIS